MKKTCALLALLCVLVCTACPVFADEVASHISFFEDGNIVETRSPEEFFRGDGSERTQAFLNNIINI